MITTARWRRSATVSAAGFRNIRANVLAPARVPKPSRPGPGRPQDSKNRKPAPRHEGGKTVKRERTLHAHLAARG